MRITVQASTGLVRDGLEDLFAEMPKVSRRRMRTSMERIKRRMQEYPPEPPGQSRPASHPVLGTVYRRAPGRYQRTGNLGSHWAIAENDKKSGYTLTNTAQRKGRFYGRYVVGGANGAGQAWMHQGRWQLLRDVVDEEVATLPDEIRDDLRIVARSRGFSS